MASVKAQHGHEAWHSLQMHRCCTLVCFWLTISNTQSVRIALCILFRAVSAEHPPCFRAAEDAPCLRISRPVAASGSEDPAAPSPSSSPMRSSFQVQQSSINLIHSPTPRESQPPLVVRKPVLRPPPQPAPRSCRCASVAPCGGPHSFLLPAACTFLRRFIQHSCWPMNALSRREEDVGGPTSNTPSGMNARSGGGVSSSDQLCGGVTDHMKTLCVSNAPTFVSLLSTYLHLKNV